MKRPSLGAILAELIRKHEVRISPENAAEVRVLGYTVPPAIKVAPPDDEAVLVCMPYSDAAGPMLPGNHVGPCDACGRPIQFRPDVSAVKRKICFHCLDNEP
jgi:hypothetical protein